MLYVTHKNRVTAPHRAACRISTCVVVHQLATSRFPGERERVREGTEVETEKMRHREEMKGYLITHSPTFFTFTRVTLAASFKTLQISSACFDMVTTKVEWQYSLLRSAISISCRLK